MYYALVEIGSFRQMKMISPAAAEELRELLRHFSQNRGVDFLLEHDGYFLFRFGHSRDQVLDRAADFLVLTRESLQKRRADLFGYNLILEDDPGPADAALGRLKALLFEAPQMDSVWLGPRVLESVPTSASVRRTGVLGELLGLPQRTKQKPLTVEELFSVTGWVDALKRPVKQQLDTDPAERGKILRLKGSHLEEKAFVLRAVLCQLYGEHDQFPLFFPLTESHDVLVQLLAQVEMGPSLTPVALDAGNRTLLSTRGGDEYAGDFGTHDAPSALRAYFLAAMDSLIKRQLPPVFVFLVPDRYLLEAQSILEDLLSELVNVHGLHLLLLESSQRVTTFLSRQPSLTWSFPPLSASQMAHELDSRAWGDRFAGFDLASLDLSSGRGLGVAHALWAWQEWGRPLEPHQVSDPSQAVLESLEPTHHRLALALWASGGLLTTDQLSAFFHEWGEDANVVEERLAHLEQLGFFLGRFPGLLRPDWGEWLLERLGDEAERLLHALGRYHFRAWGQERRLSELLFSRLKSWQLESEAVLVLKEYVHSRIQQGQRGFLKLLRPSLWNRGCREATADRLKMVSTAAKLRWALNLPFESVGPQTLDRLTRWFGPRTGTSPDGEWSLQRARLSLALDENNEGFTWLKQAVTVAQSEGDPRLQVRTYVELGMALMRRHRSDEGQEYLVMAVKGAERSGSAAGLAYALQYLATAQFVSGQLSLALESIRWGLQVVDVVAHRGRTVFFQFLEARTRFELGDYEACREPLTRAVRLARTYGLEAAQSVLLAWQGRVEAYCGDPVAALVVLESLAPSADQAYFEAEAAFLCHDLARSEAAIRRASDRVPRTLPFGFGETLAFRTSFSDIEDRWLERKGDRGVLEHQIDAFRALLAGLRQDPAAFEQQFPELASHRSVIELDPHAPVFYYWYYLAVPKDSGSNDALRMTLLGRSLKTAQSRSSRITDPAQRQEYLSRPYWNSRFVAESKKLKLV